MASVTPEMHGKKEQKMGGMPCVLLRARRIHVVRELDADRFQQRALGWIEEVAFFKAHPLKRRSRDGDQLLWQI